ncbi:MAG: signal transduction histidine kinase [Polyangiales bacterium]
MTRRSTLTLGEGTRDFGRERVAWLIALRWQAMGAALFAAVVAKNIVPGVSAVMVAATSIAGLCYNAFLWRHHRAGKPARGLTAPFTQALADITLLTSFLWASGGLDSPFSAFYLFHVVLVAILSDRRRVVIAVGITALYAGWLAFTAWVPALQLGQWNPIEPFDVLTRLVAFGLTLTGSAYLVGHSMRDIRGREQELEAARDEASLEYRLLSNTLDELEAGLEVVDGDGQVLWRNRRAELIAERSDRAAVDESQLHPRASGTHRFAVRVSNDERVYEALTFPIDEDDHAPRVMNLYLDRTQETLAEAQLLLAERLASLGRVAQGVAHELNTPLATISTLATDMRHVVSALRAAMPEHASETQDLDESAALIRDETRRLGKITQALLAGGDLVRAETHDSIPLLAAAERARAIVTAGRGPDSRVEIDESVQIHAVADGDKLVQVLVNLLQNALDASRKTGGIVRVSAIGSDTGVEIQVSDEGEGLDDSMVDRLFEPFATTKPPGEGTGLGLYMSYMIVHRMGGTLSLENRDEGGALARVQLRGIIGAS